MKQDLLYKLAEKYSKEVISGKEGKRSAIRKLLKLTKEDAMICAYYMALVWKINIPLILED